MIRYCHYLSGEGLSGKTDEDRCKNVAAYSLRFVAEHDDRRSIPRAYYCDVHAPTVFAGFLVYDVREEGLAA